MASRRLERFKDIVGGVVFVAGALACIYPLVVVDHAGWGVWDWAWRSVGILVLGAGGVGLMLGDGPPPLDVRASTERVEEPRGYVTTYDHNPILAPVVEGLRYWDPGPAHILFHTSREGAWGVREVIVRLCYDRYAQTFSRGVMQGFLERTTYDPCWVLLRAYWSQQKGQGGDALADLARAHEADPADPTPLVMKIGLLAPAIAEQQEAYDLVHVAYAQALRLAPLYYEAHEQLMRAYLFRKDDVVSAVLGVARQAAAAAPEGSDEAFLPVVAHALLYRWAGGAYGKGHGAAYLAEQQRLGDLAGELALACRRSFDSPHYKLTHRTYRLLHTAASLHAAIGDRVRLHSELERAGKTFDPDVWAPFDKRNDPAQAFRAAHKLVRTARSPSGHAGRRVAADPRSKERTESDGGLRR